MSMKSGTYNPPDQGRDDPVIRGGGGEADSSIRQRLRPLTDEELVGESLRPCETGRPPTSSGP